MGKALIPLRIAGVGYNVPETIITNDDLTKLYDTSDEWIFTRTGIKERRLVSGNEDAVDLGYKASLQAVEKSGFKPDEIDMVIAATSAPPQLYPALACQIQTKLGISNHAPAFDITAACSGLIYALSIAKAYIASGMYKTILIVATDNNSRLLNWEDRTTSILFGDGAGAMVVTASEDGIDDTLRSLLLLLKRFPLTVLRSFTFELFLPLTELRLPLKLPLPRLPLIVPPLRPPLKLPLPQLRVPPFLEGR